MLFKYSYQLRLDLRLSAFWGASVIERSSVSIIDTSLCSFAGAFVCAGSGVVGSSAKTVSCIPYPAHSSTLDVFSLCPLDAPCVVRLRSCLSGLVDQSPAACGLGRMVCALCCWATVWSGPYGLRPVLLGHCVVWAVWSARWATVSLCGLALCGSSRLLVIGMIL